jgi:hypothetical protein
MRLLVDFRAAAILGRCAFAGRRKLRFSWAVMRWRRTFVAGSYMSAENV